MHECVLLQIRDYLHMSYPLSATVIDIGRISDVLVIRGRKSFVSCIVGVLV